jgi:hypothetical protein
MGQLERANLSPHLKMETDPVSETCFLVFKISNKRQNPETH